MSKGFNRGLGTLTAGGLALAVAELSKNLGALEEVILIISIFTVGKHWGMLRSFPGAFYTGVSNLYASTFMFLTARFYHKLGKATPNDEAL